MRQGAVLAVILVLALAGQALAQGGGLADYRSKSPIGPDDRQAIAHWLAAQTKKMAAPTAEGDFGAMTTARAAILFEGKRDATWSKEYVQTFGEEAIKALQGIEKQSLGTEARLNVVMTVADLRRIEGLPFLEKVLTGDPYSATKYWAAKGLSELADVIVGENKLHEEQEVAKTLASAMQNETDPFILYYIIDALGHFDQEAAHDALAEGVVKAAPRLNANDAVAAQTLVLATKAVERAYAGDVRPEAKTRLLSAFAALCADVMPPTADPTIMSGINAALEKALGEGVGFQPTDSAVLQKLALMEWVEKLVKAKKIPARPALPPAVERVLKESSGAPETPTKPPEPAPKATEPAPKAPETPAKKDVVIPPEPAPKKAAEPAAK